jgi:tripartite-type tricarboxylate transporter receptor subunit TctC
MKSMPKQALALVRIALAATLLVATVSHAQSYPTKPIKFIVPVAAGGGADMIARSVAERLGRNLGQTLVVDNVSGGGGVIASETTMRATPDGYTLMQGYVATHATSPASRKLKYDPIKDFTPIGMIGGTPNVLIVPVGIPANNVKEFLAYAKQNVGKISYGSAGQGSLTHLAMEQFKEATGMFAVHVPYRGIAPAITDMLSGSTQAMMPSLAAATPHIRSGKFRPLAVTGAKRHPNFPEVPTLNELGYKGFDGMQWYGIFGPPKLPADIVKRVHDELQKAIAAPDLKQRLSAEAVELLPMSTEQFASYVAADFARYQRVVKERKLELSTD